MSLRTEILEAAADMREWRRHLHAHPEIAYEERGTADYVARLLTDWGIEVHRGLAVTGVVGTLKLGSSGRSIGLRADMDALPLQEKNGFGHKSTVPGKMHACGHDGHMAMLLGAARHLARTRNFDGTIRFIFQPAEENVAGARRMVEEGLFDLFPVDAVFGMHNMPGVEAGKIVVTPGAMMASSDFFQIVVKGKGSHGAWPHRGVDVIGIASEIVLAFNHLKARTIDPLEPAVISVTKFNSGFATNVMPEEATIAGTTRAFREEVQDHMEANMRRIAEGIAAAHGAEIQFTYERRYPPVVNNIEESAFAAAAAARVVGEANVIHDEPPAMGAEDFAWMLKAKKGSYVWIGNGTGPDKGCMLHNPNYDFNDDVASVGAAYWVELAESWLKAE